MKNMRTSTNNPLSKKPESALLLENDPATAVAIWTEDIILDPGTVRYPIRVVVVDNLLQTRLDRLVQLPKDCITYIYRVLDHGIPWQHLEAGLTLEQVKKQLLAVVKGKRVVTYDSWKTIGVFHFTEQQLSRMKIYDIRSSVKSLGPDKKPLPYWALVEAKLGHRYTGKPGNYDALELTDFIMSIYIKYVKEDEQVPADLSSIVDQLQLNSKLVPNDF